MSNNSKKEKAVIIPLDMRRRPMCGPAGNWENCNPTVDGPEKPFRHYSTSSIKGVARK